MATTPQVPIAYSMGPSSVQLLTFCIDVAQLMETDGQIGIRLPFSASKQRLSTPFIATQVFLIDGLSGTGTQVLHIPPEQVRKKPKK